MKLKDSKKSVKILFLIRGIFGVINIFKLNLNNISIDLIINIVHIIFGGVFLYIYSDFGKIIKNSSEKVIKFLLLSTTFSVIAYFYYIYTTLFSSNLENNIKVSIVASSIFRSIIRVLIYLYLRKTITRLSTEEK